MSRIRKDASAAMAELRAARDAEIRQLRAAGLSYAAIGAAVGCSGDLVREILNPEHRRRRNERRRRHWRRQHLKAVA